MRRGYGKQQKKSAMETSWTNKWTRRGGTRRPGVGKSLKKAMARRRRRWPIPED